MNKPSGVERLTDASLAASASTALSDNEDLSKATSWLLTITATFNAAATAGLRLYLYPTYDGTNFDTQPWDGWFWQMDVNDAGNPEIRTSPPLNVSPKGCKFLLTNLDGAQAITSITVHSVVTNTG